VLSLEPGHCLLVIGELLGSGASSWRGKGDLLTRREQQGFSVVAGVQVVVEDAANRSSAFGLAVVIASLVGGVSAQQVVQSVSAGGALADQVGAAELAEQAAGFRLGCSGEAGGGWNADVGPECRPSSRNMRAACTPSC
jgi:hypothetical protein